jgi:hypothetical protein
MAVVEAEVVMTQVCNLHYLAVAMDWLTQAVAVAVAVHQAETQAMAVQEL